MQEYASEPIEREILLRISAVFTLSVIHRFGFGLTAVIVCIVVVEIGHVELKIEIKELRSNSD